MQVLPPVGSFRRRLAIGLSILMVIALGALAVVVGAQMAFRLAFRKL